MTQFYALHATIINNLSTGKIDALNCVRFRSHSIIMKFKFIFLSIAVSIQFQMNGQRGESMVFGMPNAL